MEDYSKKAEDFLKNEKQFHLGILETEKSHPLTKDFTNTLKKNVSNGVQSFLRVDRDIVTKSAQVFQSAEYAELVRSIVQTALNNHMLIFSGCGSTGRLGVLLETMWREFWLKAAKNNQKNCRKWQARAECTYSMITGGDLALIRSVENFEDYQSFGRRQAQEAKILKGDLFLGITEGGETSSVIGSVWQAREQGAKTFFIFNNPVEILTANIQRSKEILECSDIVSMDLTTGPMALSGSTRLQATTIGLLVIGAAIEEAAIRLLEKEDETAHSYWKNCMPQGYTREFQNLLDDLEDNTAMIARFALMEADIYRQNALATYFADEYLLDIFSDTTERTPTFKLPPFKPLNDASANASWAFAKGLLYNTQEQWYKMLYRAPRGLIWQKQDYTALGGPTKYIENPPRLGLDQIYRYPIGIEADPERHSSQRDTAVFFYVENRKNQDYIEQLHRAFARTSQPWNQIIHVSVNSASPAHSSLNFQLTLNESPCSLMTHLAVKLIFNTMSNTCMGLMGRIRGNWMVQVDATNKKLIDRSIRLISSLGNVSYEQGCLEFFKTLSMPTAPNQSNESIVERTLRRL